MTTFAYIPGVDLILPLCCPNNVWFRLGDFQQMRPDTFGMVDEATLALGLARAVARDPNLSRLSDLVFMLARYIEVKSSLAELPG